MASPTPPASTTADHDDRAACSQKMMESIIRPLAQCSAEAAFKGISAILHQNDTLQEKNASLKEDLEASDKTNMRIVDRIQAVEAERDQKQVALDRLKEESANGQAKLKQAHDQVAKLTTEITANKEEITNTFKSKQDKEQQLETKNQENSAQKEELRKRGEILKDTRKALEELQQNYDKDHAELVSLRSKAVSLQEVPKSARPALIERVRSIFEKAHELVYQFFGQSELDTHVFKGEKWQILAKDKRLEGIPLVPTNSKVATQMRVASVLRILALSALEHLFQPVFLTEFGTEVSAFIDHLYQSNSEYAHWIRSVLLNIEPETQTENARKRVEAVVEDVVECLDFLLQPAGTSKQFRSALEQWCEESTQAWLDLQRLTFAFQCFFELHIQDIQPKEWAPLPESPILPRKAGIKETNGGSATNGSGKTTSCDTNKHDMASANIAAQIWPLVLAVRKDGKSELVRRGYMLTEPQVRAALDEVVPSGPQNRNHQRLRRQERNRQMTSLPNNSTESFL